MAAPPSRLLFDLKDRPRVGFSFFLASSFAFGVVFCFQQEQNCLRSRRSQRWWDRTMGRQRRKWRRTRDDTNNDKKLALNTPAPDEALIY